MNYQSFILKTITISPISISTVRYNSIGSYLAKKIFDDFKTDFYYIALKNPYLKATNFIILLENISFKG